MSCLINKFVNKGIIAAAVDVKTRFCIKVTGLDVARSKRRAPDQCPIANALCRSVPNATHGIVYKSAVYFAYIDAKGRKQTRRGIPSKVLRAQIDGYDEGLLFAPGTYWVEPPEKSQTLKAARARSLKRPGRHEEGNTKITRQPRTHGRLQFKIVDL